MEKLKVQWCTCSHTTVSQMEKLKVQWWTCSHTSRTRCTSRTQLRLALPWWAPLLFSGPHLSPYFCLPAVLEVGGAWGGEGRQRIPGTLPAKGVGLLWENPWRLSVLDERKGLSRVGGSVYAELCAAEFCMMGIQKNNEEPEERPKCSCCWVEMPACYLSAWTISVHNIQLLF